MNTFEKFKIIAWRAVYYHRRLTKLSPDYARCPSWCGLNRRKDRRWCDSCPVQLAFDQFKQECVDLADERGFDFESGAWTFEVLFGHLALVSELEAAHGETGYKPWWTIRTVRLVDAVRAERSRARRADDWRREKRAKRARRNKPGTRGGRYDDEDDED